MDFNGPIVRREMNSRCGKVCELCRAAHCCQVGHGGTKGRHCTSHVVFYGKADEFEIEYGYIYIYIYTYIHRLFGKSHMQYT